MYLPFLNLNKFRIEKYVNSLRFGFFEFRFPDALYINIYNSAKNPVPDELTLNPKINVMTFKIAIILPLHKKFFYGINIVVQTNTQKNLTRSFD